MVKPYQRIVSLVCIACETCECERCNVEDLAKRIIDDVRADAIDSVMELFERQNVYDFNCEDCPIYRNSDCNCEEGAYKWFKQEVEKLKEQNDGKSNEM